MTPEQQRVQSFNESFGIGKSVSYTNENGEVITSHVRFPAEIIESGMPVVWVDGDYNAVYLKEVIWKT
jgi:hypothetical protein